MMNNKRYVSAQELLNDSFELGIRIFKSGFKPSFIIGVWRGGTPVAIAVQEILDHFGLKTDHIAIRTSSYCGINKKISASGSMAWSMFSCMQIGMTGSLLWTMYGTAAIALKRSSRPLKQRCAAICPKTSGLQHHGISRITMQRTSFQTTIFMRLASGWFFPTNWKVSH